jgi:hypothetical protein
MKNMRIIIIGLGITLLCAVFLFGVFAPHSTQMINASGGQIDIDITNVEIGYVSEHVEISPSSVVVKNDNKTVAIGVQNLYASSETNVSIEITNTGLLPIKFTWIRQDIDEIVDINTELPSQVETLQDLSIRYDLYSRNNEGENTLKATETISVSEDTMRALEGVRQIIQPGETVLLDVKIMVKSDSGIYFENKSFAFSITPFFLQAF